MKTLHYRSFEDKHKHSIYACNVASNNYPLIINTAGSTSLKWPFRTVNPTGREDYYFMYLKLGELTVKINGKTFTAKEGSLIIIPPNTPYEYYQLTDKELFYYWVHFTGSATTQILTKLGFNNLPILRETPKSSSQVTYQMTRIFNCYIKNGFHRDVELAHFLDAMLIDIAKNASEPENKIQKLSTSINYINENYTKELNVPELAKMEFLSVSRYIALFKEVTGSSPYQYVISLRLNTACEMLRDSSLSVTQIAEVLGFQNCFFFSKLFKKHLKMSPTQYKKQSLNIKAD